MGRAEWANSSGHGPRPDREWVEGSSRRSRLRRREASPVNTNPDLLNTLVTLVRQQQAVIDNAPYEMFLGFGDTPEEGQRMLDTFLDSPFFQPVFDIAVKESKLVRDEFSEEDYRRYLAGKTFETLAVSFKIAQEAQKGNVVLTPDNVHALYLDYVYPGEEPIEFPFGNIVVGHHGQPDSISVDPRTMDIKTVYECTATGNYNKYKRQERSFRRVQERGVIFSRATGLDFIIPTQDQNGMSVGGFGVVKLPFTHEQFRGTMRQVYGDMRRDGKTLEESFHQTREQHAQAEMDERLRNMGVTIVRTPMQQQPPQLGFAT